MAASSLRHLASIEVVDDYRIGDLLFSALNSYTSAEPWYEEKASIYVRRVSLPSYSQNCIFGLGCIKVSRFTCTPLTISYVYDGRIFPDAPQSEVSSLGK